MRKYSERNNTDEKKAHQINDELSKSGWDTWI